MVEPKYNPVLGLWECPLCGFRAMSKKVIANHIKREHPEAASSHPSQNGQKLPEKGGANGNKKPKNGKHPQGQNNGGKVKKRKWKRFKVGDTVIKVEDREEVEVHDQRGWVFFLTANYVAALHKQRVRLKLATGEEFEGLLKARDPYFVGLILQDGQKLYINKAHIVWIRPIKGGDQ